MAVKLSTTSNPFTGVMYAPSTSIKRFLISISTFVPPEVAPIGVPVNPVDLSYVKSRTITPESTIKFCGLSGVNPTFGNAIIIFSSLL